VRAGRPASHAALLLSLIASYGIPVVRLLSLLLPIDRACCSTRRFMCPLLPHFRLRPPSLSFPTSFSQISCPPYSCFLNHMLMPLGRLPLSTPAQASDAAGSACSRCTYGCVAPSAAGRSHNARSSSSPPFRPPRLHPWSTGMLPLASREPQEATRTSASRSALGLLPTDLYSHALRPAFLASPPALPPPLRHPPPLAAWLR